MLSDPREKGLPLINISVIHNLCTLNEFEVPEDMLRFPVGRLGKRHSVAFSGSVLNCSNHELLSNALPCETIGNSEKIQMEHLTPLRCVAGQVSLRQVSQDARDRPEFLIQLG